jgi:N4-gp56 family major capsid protein
MADTIFTTSNALTKKAWEEKLFRETIPESYSSRFFGEGADAMFHVKTNLEKSQGDKITFGLVARLAGDGVTGDDQLEGNEESLVTYDDAVTIDQYRHGVTVRGRMSQQRAVFSITSEAKMQLKQWQAEKIDRLAFTALLNSPSAVYYRDSTGAPVKGASAATAKAGLDATNSKLNLATFSYLRTLAKTGNNRAFSPLRPIKIKGKEYYVLLVHEDVLYDIKQDTNFLQAQRECQERSADHPLFVGATALYDGVIVHTHEFIPIATDGGAGAVAWSKGVLMGAQALVWAWGERPSVVQKDFDYENKTGYAVNMICGAKKPTFNSLDFGSYGAYFARTKVSG